MSLSAQRRARIRRRAQQACEYCHLPQRASILPHHIDHVIAQHHLGADDENNLVCVACVVTSRRAPTSHRPTPVQGACTISCLYFTHGSSGGRSTFTCEKTVA